MPYDPVYNYIWQSYDPTFQYEPQFNTFQFEGFQDGIPIYSNEPRPNPKTGRMEYTGQMNGKTYYYRDKNGNLTLRSDAPSDNWSPSGLMSVLTGGFSDLAQGRPFGSGSVGLINDVFPEHTFLGKVLPSLLLPAESGYRDIQRIATSDRSPIEKVSSVFERMADPTNSVNYSLEHFGSVLPKGVKDALPAILGTIGTVIYPVAGSALGYGIGSHIRGDSSTQALLGAGTSATASYLGGQVGNLLGPTNTLGVSYSDILRGAAQPLASQLASKGVSTVGSVLGGLLADPIAKAATSYVNPSSYNPVNPYSLGGLLDTTTPELLNRSSMKSTQPSFERTELPKLASYSDDKKKKLAELLTDPYKNYTLSDYALYKADPEQLKALIDAQYIA